MGRKWSKLFFVSDTNLMQRKKCDWRMKRNSYFAYSCSIDIDPIRDDFVQFLSKATNYHPIMIFDSNHDFSSESSLSLKIVERNFWAILSFLLAMIFRIWFWVTIRSPLPSSNRESRLVFPYNDIRSSVYHSKSFR